MMSFLLGFIAGLAMGYGLVMLLSKQPVADAPAQSKSGVGAAP
jgi:hypothetical protein